jgi:polyphosphate kinase
MTRNLSRRVETIFPLEDEKFIRYIRDDVLETYLKDNVNARLMKSDGSYSHVKVHEGDSRVDVQQWLIDHPHGNLN